MYDNALGISILNIKSFSFSFEGSVLVGDKIPKATSPAPFFP